MSLTPAATGAATTATPPAAPPPPFRLFAGILADIRARAPHYASDWREGFCHPRTLSAAAFALFAQAIPAAAFAGLLHHDTGGALGVPEALLAMGACGLLFALFAGQPLVLVGTTGPVCLLVAQLHQLSIALHVHPRGALFYTSIWAAVICMALAACSAPRALALRLTAFSADAFGALVGLVYVVQGSEGLWALAGAQGSGGASLGLGLGAAAAAAVLARARALQQLLLPAPPAGRPAAALAAGALTDYALPLAVLALSAAAAAAPGLAGARAAGLPLLPVPAALAPSQPGGRPWLDAAAIASVPPWAAAAAAAPGLVLAALLFFDHQVSALLSQAPAFNLRKPSAYDLDFCLLGASLLLTGTLGLPPVYGLLPQAPLHVAALQLAPAQPGGQPGRVLETRWSAALQAAGLLALLSPPLLGALGAVPQGVMAGVLLYLGGEGLASNGAVRRGVAAAAQVGGLPQGAGWLAALQAALVLGIFGLTRSAAGALFPVLICALVPLRLVVLPRVMGEGVVEALDPRDWGRGAVEEGGGKAEQAEQVEQAEGASQQ